jgi:pimeloyl-ACP methyl ester carboxylesterase
MRRVGMLVGVCAALSALSLSSVAGATPHGFGAGKLPDELCDQVFEKHHYVKVEEGVRLHVIEKFSLRSTLRWPRRAVSMITPTLVTNEVFDAHIADDPSYNALETVARHGYFAFATSFEGYGESTQPADGKTVTGPRSLEQAGKIVEWIRKRRQVNKVDLLGGSLGSGIAVALGGVASPIDPDHVGRIVLTSFVYKSFAPPAAAVFTPELGQFLASLPGGYVDTDTSFYFPVVLAATPEAQAWAFATYPGHYAVGPTLEAFDLPFFEAADGRAPALQFYGDQDVITALDDVELFHEEYGGPIELVVQQGAAHAPFLEPGRHEFWDATLAFYDEGDGGQVWSLCD